MTGDQRPKRAGFGRAGNIVMTVVTLLFLVPLLILWWRLALGWM